MAFIIANKAVILGCLWALSESLASIPQVNANSVFQLVFGILKSIAGK